MSIRPSSLARQRVAGLRERNRRVEQHRQLVRPLALRYARQSRESVDDLTQVGLLGLIRAAELYRSNQGSPFEAFARPHIRGAILHYLRDIAPLVRLPRRQAELQDQFSRLERSLGPGAAEISSPASQGERTRQALGLDQQRWQDLLQLRQLRNPLPLEVAELEEVASETSFSVSGQDEEAVDVLLDGLEPRQRLVVRGVVLEGLSYRRLGEQLQVSPMTVQRLLHRGLAELRNQLDGGRISDPGLPRPWPCRAASAARAC